MKRTAMVLLFVAACARQGGLDIDDDDSGLGGSSPSGGGGVGGTAIGGSSSGNAPLAGTSSVAGRAGAPSGGSAGAASGGTGSSGAGASGGKAGAAGAGGGGTAGGGTAGSGTAGSGTAGTGPITQTGITARFKAEETNTSSAVPAIHGEMRVVNTDGGNASLKLLKVRYYFTNEGAAPLFQIRWGQLQAPTLAVDMPYTGTVVSMPNPTSTADSYIEFLYSGDGVLDAGKTAVASFRLYDSTNQAVFHQDNDYSFSATPVDSDKVVVFYRDSVIWGVEPK